MEKIKVNLKPGQKKIEVQFNGGQMSNAFKGEGNWMLANVPIIDEDGYKDEIRLYAELAISDAPDEIAGATTDSDEFDWIPFDEYSYPILVNEIKGKAIEAGIDASLLHFFWDEE